MSLPRLGLLLSLSLVAVHLTSAQTVVNSVFTPHGAGYYGDANNWSPPEVPNNSPEKIYNITIPSFQIRMNFDATVSNVTLDSTSVLSDGQSHTFTVIGATTIKHSSPQQLWDFFLTAPNPVGSTFAAGSLSTFSAGSLTGWYYLSNYTLQFNGADVTSLSGEAVLALVGPNARLVDEVGNDGLRHLTRIDSGSTLQLSAHQTVVAGPFTNDGLLTLSSGSDQPSFFTIAGALTNFDVATRTLISGDYHVVSSSQPTVLQFDGADIVHNGGTIALAGSLAKIVDQHGSDALRNFSHNTSTGVFSVSGRDFSIPANFTNDGVLSPGGTFTVEGLLTNFDPATRTLTGGTYQLGGSGRFVFAGADIVDNAASIYLFGGGKILDENGNDALRNFAHNLKGGEFTINESYIFTAAGDFTNAGLVNVLGAGDISRAHFTVPEGHRYIQTEGETLLSDANFTGQMEIAGGSFATAGNPFFGNPAFLDGDLTLGDASFFARSFTVQGAVHLSAASRFFIGAESDTRFLVEETFTAGGTLQIIPPRFRPSSMESHLVVQSGGGILGTFSNAPNGARVPTTDGLGSFVVSYTPNDIFISGFQAIPPAAQLLNISTRAHVRTDDHVTIGGFVIFGRDPKEVIVRGLGPSLTSSGIGGALQNPTLELHGSNGAIIVTNDNWQDSQAAEIQASGLAPSDDRESAIIATVAPGAYTVVLAGKSNTIGIGLVEVYDLAREQSKIANISTRGFVDPQDVLIGGFIAGGSGEGNAEVVVRAIGPRLSWAGVTGFLPDPTLELVDGQGNLLAFNDDCGDAPENFDRIDPSLYLFNAKDAALPATLPPGAYTAIVRGKSGASGIALVEVYDMNR